MTTDRFYGWHPCPRCGQVGFSNTLNNEMHDPDPVEYPATSAAYCQSCPHDLCVTFPTADALPLIQIGPPVSVGPQAALVWLNEAFARAEKLAEAIRSGLDPYALIAEDPNFVVGQPSVPDQVPSCMRAADA